MAPTLCTVLTVVLNFVVKLSLVQTNNTSGICSKKNEPVACCADYRLHGDKCVRCVGFIGHQCITKCAPGFFGIGCLQNCSCSPCNNINGSCDDEQYNNEILNAESPSWPIFLSGITVAFGFIAVVAVFIILKKRLSLAVNADSGTSEQKTDVSDNDVNAIDMSYDDVRESQMVLDETDHFPRVSNGTFSKQCLDTDIYNVAVHNFRMTDSIYA